MAETVSVITLQGKDELSKILETNTKQFKTFTTETEKSKTNVDALNKVLKTTGESFKIITTNSKEAVEGIHGMNRGFKSSYSDSVRFGGNLIKTSDTVSELTSGFKGLALSVAGAKKPFELFGSSIEGPVEHLRAIADSRDPTERFFNVVTRVSKPAGRGFAYLGQQAENVRRNIGNLEKGVNSFSSVIATTGANSMKMFSSTFDTLATAIKERGGLFSGAISNTMLGIGDAAEKASKNMEKFSKTINPDDLNKVDKAGISIAKTFAGLEDKFKGLATGADAADFVSNVYLGLRATQDFVNEGLIPSTLAAKDATVATAQFGSTIVANMGPFASLGMVAGAIKDGFLGIIPAFRGVKKGILEVVSQFDDIAVAASVMTMLVSAVDKAQMAWVDLNSTVETMTNLGINTYSIEAATSIGKIGENLIFSTQAAREFGQAAMTAFAQFEDAASFVTTLTSGAAFRFEGAEAGIESIGLAMNELVSGPLNNMVTSIEASNSLYNALSAGIGLSAGKIDEFGRAVANTSEVMSFMEAGLKLSSATGTDAASTMEVLSKVTEVYNLSNLQASQTAAKLNAVVENGVTTFPQLVGGLSRTASVAASAGVSIDELFGSIAALTRVMSTQDVQTGYASLISAIAGQGAQAQKAVKELGIQFDIQTVKSDGLIASLERLNEATNGNITKLKEIIPDQLAFQTAQTLMNTSLEDAKNIMEAVGEASSESLDEIFSNRSQSMVKRMTALANGFNETLIDMGQRVLPSIEPGIAFMERLLTFMQEMPDPLKNIIGGIILFHTTLGRITETVFSLLGSFIQISATLMVFRMMGLAMKSFQNAIKGATNAKDGLGGFIKMLQWLVFEEKNIIGAWMHLTGINRRFQHGLLETIKAQRQFNITQEEFSEYAGADDTWRLRERDLDNYQQLLEKTEVKLKEAKRQHEEMPDAGLDTRVKNLQSMKRNMQKLIAQEKLARAELLREVQAEVTEALDDTAVSVSQKKAVITKTFVEAFDRFDDQTIHQMRNFASEIEVVMNHANSTTAEKLAAIKQRFEVYMDGLPESVRKDTRKIFDQYVVFIKDVENLPKYYESKVRTAYKRLLDAIPEEARQSLEGDETQQALIAHISDINTTIGDRKGSIRQAVRRLLDGFPEEIAANKDEIEKAFEDLITADPKNLDHREQVFKNALQKTVKNMGTAATAEVREQARIIQSALLDFSRVFNEPARKGANLQWARVIAQGGKEALEALDVLQTQIRASFVGIKDEIDEQAKKGGGSIQAYYDAVKNVTIAATNDTKEVVQKKLDELAKAYEALDIQDESVAASVKASYEKLSNAIKTSALTKTIQEQRQTLETKLQGIKTTLANIGDADTQAKILSNIVALENRIRDGFEDLSNVTRADIERMVKETEDSLKEFGDSLSPAENETIKESLARLKTELGKGFTEAKEEITKAAQEFKGEAETAEQAIKYAMTGIENAMTLDEVILIDESVEQSAAMRAKRAAQKLIDHVKDEVRALVKGNEVQLELKLDVESVDLPSEAINNELEQVANEATVAEVKENVNEIQQELNLGDVQTKEKVAEINQDLTEIANEKAKQEVQDNLKQIQTEFEQGLDKIDAEVGSPEHTEQVKTLVERVNDKLKQIAQHPDIVASVKQNMDKVIETVEAKSREMATKVVDGTTEAVQNSNMSDSMRNNATGLISTLGSLTGVNTSVITDLVDLMENTEGLMEDFGNSTAKVAKKTDTATKTWRSYWDSVRESKGSFKEAYQSQNALVAVLNVLGGAYHGVLVGVLDFTKAKIAETGATIKGLPAKAANIAANTAELATDGTRQAALWSVVAAKIAEFGADLRSIPVKIKNIALNISETIAKGANTAATSALAGANWAATAATTALGHAMKAFYGSVLMPITVTLGLVAVGVWGVAKALGMLPSYAEKTSKAIRETREELEKLRAEQNRVSETQKDSTELAVKQVEAFRSIKRASEAANKAALDGAVGFQKIDASLRSFREEATELPTLVTGPLTGIVRVLDFILVTATKLVGVVTTLFGKLVEGLGWVIVRIGEFLKFIPGVEWFLGLIGRAVQGIGNVLHTLDDILIKNIREGLNNVSDALTRIDEKTKANIKAMQDLTDEALKASRIALGEMQGKGAASQEGKDILLKVKAEQRAMNAEEMKKFQQAETDFLEEEKAVVNARVKALDTQITDLEKELEKHGRLSKNKQAMLDAAKEEKQQALDTITELEEWTKKRIEYQQNINSMISLVEENNASKDILLTNEKVAQTYAELPEEAKKAYAEILGIQIESVEEGGEVVNRAIQTNYDLFNRGQRQKYLAFTTSLARVADNVAKATDINSQDTLDKLQSDIFGFAESAQGMLEAGFDPETVLTQFEQGLSAFKIQFEEAGMSAEQMDLLDVAGQEALLDLMFEMHKAVSENIIAQNEHQISVINLQNKKGVGDRIENLEQVFKLEEANAQEQINLNKKKLKQLEDQGLTNSVTYLNLVNTVALQEMELDQQVFDNKLKLIDEELKIVTEKKEFELEQLKALDSMNIGNKLQNLQAINDLEESLAQSRIDANKEKLAEMAQDERLNSVDYINLQREIALEELALDKLVMDNKVEMLDQEFKLIELQQKNIIDALKNTAQAESMVLELQQKRLDLQKQILESRNKVTAAIEEYEISALNNINKLETDRLKQAENNLEIFIKRGEAQERLREFELLSLEHQEKANELSFLKEKSQLRINRLEAELGILQAKNALEKAKQTNATEDEIRSLQLALEAAQLTSDAYAQQSIILEEQSTLQQELAQNERKALEAQQRAQEEAYATDLILEQNKVTLAAYDQQIAKLQNMAQIQKITADVIISKREAETTILTNQLELLRKQEEFVKSAQDRQQNAYSIAMDMAKSEYKRQKLEREAAEARLKNLKAAQESEERIFELNQRQQRLALEIAVIKSDAASSQAQADLLVARAEAQKVMADVTASQEMKAAALATVQAAEVTYQSAQIQQTLTREQQNVFEETAAIEREQLEADQQLAVLQAQADLAKTTPGWGDDRRVGRQAEAFARGRTREEQQQYEREQAEIRRRNQPTPEQQQRIDDREEQRFANLAEQERVRVQELIASQRELVTPQIDLGSSQLRQLEEINTQLRDAINRELNLFSMPSPLSAAVSPTTGVLGSTPNVLSGSLSVDLNINVEGSDKIDTENLNKQVTDVVYTGLYDLFNEMRIQG